MTPYAPPEGCRCPLLAGAWVARVNYFNFKIIPYIYILEDKKFPLNELNNNKKKIMLKIQKKSQDTNLKSFLLKIS